MRNIRNMMKITFIDYINYKIAFDIQFLHKYKLWQRKTEKEN